MKLQQYIENLQKIADQFPALDVIYSSDDEGNSFQTVYHIPSLGHFDKSNAEFISAKHVEVSPADYEGMDTTINAVCIN